MSYGNLSRTYYDYTSANLVSPQLYVWNGRAADNSEYIYPDGNYTLTVSYRAIGSDETQSFSYELALDSTAPTLDEYKLLENGILSVSASDNTSVGNIFVCDNNGDSAVSKDNGKWDISALKGKYIYIDIHDIASNREVVRIENPAYTAESDE